MNNVKNIILALQDINARIFIDKDELKVDVAKGAMDANLISLIRANKEGLMNYIKQARRGNAGPVRLAEPQSDYPLSASQYRLWLLDQMGIDGTAYNMFGVCHFTEDLDPGKFEKALKKLIDRHEALRTIFIEREGMPKQKLLDREELKFYIDLIDLSKEDSEGFNLSGMKRRVFSHKFELNRWPLFKLCIVRQGHKTELLYSMHHIISDGWSMMLFQRDILALYQEEVAGHPAQLPPLKVQYKDYAEWQNKSLAHSTLKIQGEYWRNRLGGTLPDLQLPYDFDPHTAVPDSRAGHFQLNLDKTLTEKITSFLSGKKISLFSFFIACFKIVLNRLTGGDDIIIGTPVANRDHEDTKDLIGFFLNTLMLRDRLETDSPFDVFLRQVSDTLIGALDNQAYPFEQLLESLDVTRSNSRFPISSVFLNMLNFTSAEDNGLLTKEFVLEDEVYSAKFELECYFKEYVDGVSIRCVYKTSLFKPETIAFWMNEFVSMIRQTICLPSIRLKDIKIFERPSFRKNQPQPQTPFIEFEKGSVTQSLISRFEEQVKKYPVAAAIHQDGTDTSYTELNELANGLAAAIKAISPVPGTNMALLLGHGRNAIIGMLGVLKSGNAYVPLDPGYPLERLSFILEDAGCRIIIAYQDTMQPATALRDAIEGGLIINISKDIQPESRHTAPQIDPDDKAYILYTSGSTGKPKGVIQTHRNILHYIRVYTNNLHIGAHDRLSLLPTYGFDASVSDIYSALLNGATICPYDITNRGTDSLGSWLQTNRISIMHIVPTLFRYFIEGLKDEVFDTVRLVVLGGEAVYTGDWEKFCIHFDKGALLVNTYGPTESSTVLQNLLDHHSTFTSRNVPIGVPVEETQVYLVNDKNEEVGLYQTGEIFFKSDYLSPGYLNNAALTASAFITDPITGNGRVYRSGDFGKMLPAGEIEFAGRRDSQVKRNGYRIELPDIEQNLLKINGICEAIVLIKKIRGQQQLVAYIRTDQEMNERKIRLELQGKIPPHMMPSVYMFLDQFPLTVTGKISRLGLPDPEDNGSPQTVYEIPLTTTEQQLSLIWQEILHKDRIGKKDDFFQLGGHSLKATRLTSQIHQVFQVLLPVKDLFVHPILEDQARIIDQSKRTAFTAIPSTPHRTYYPLSSSQRRLWTLSRLRESNVAYNMPGVYVFEGELDKKAFDDSFATLIDRHEILRTVFRENEEGAISQYILPSIDSGFHITDKDLRREDDPENQVRYIIREEFARPFDLSSGPLLRLTLFQVGDRKWIFLYTLHHIITDGWSMHILINELLTLYNSSVRKTISPLPALKIQYKDYSVWQQEKLKNGDFREHEEYWMKQFTGELPALDFPFDKPRPPLKTYQGAVIRRTINKKVSDGIKSLSRDQEGTLFMGLLATVAVLLYRYTDQTDMIIGSQMAGRQHVNLEDQIGYYANTVALRTRFRGEDSFKEILNKIRRVTLDAYEHQAYPFDELVDALSLQRDMSRGVLFDVSVVLQNTGILAAGDGLSPDNLKVSVYSAVESLVNKFDLAFDFVELKEEIQASLSYNSDIYHRATAEQLLDHLHNLLQATISSPDIPVNTLEFLSASDQRQQLITFNDTATGFPAGETVVQLFRQQVAKTPDNSALVFGDTVLSYKELDDLTDRLAGYLMVNGRMQPGSLAGILLDRSEKMIIAILGILKTGGAYVPIDPEYPKSRQAFIMKDTGIRTLITQSDYIFDLEYYNGFVLAIDAQLDVYSSSNNAPAIVGRSSDLAYIMYTSGSTGIPKGVMVDHISIVRLVKSTNYIRLQGDEILLSTGAVSFDATTFEYWSTLLNGGRLVLCPRETLLNVTLLREAIRENKINTMWFTAGWMNQLVDIDIEIFDGLRTLLAGGDVLSPAHIAALRRKYPDMTIINGYGPTENTTFSTTYTIGDIAGPIPIGKPISNSTVYILDPRGRLLPAGAIGELHVGGAGLARGYLNNEQLTAEKFVPHPFKENQRLYKTGDMGRWLSDGNVEFLGRRDNQVKIRGHRIEIGEIERILQDQDVIDSAVVICKPDHNGDKQLIAYLVGKGGLAIQSLRTRIRHLLPPYMIPDYFVTLDSLPLNSNGKVDRSLLPDPLEMTFSTGTEYIAPRNLTEEKLAMIWQDILGKEKIGIKDNFFDLGGHSVKAIRLIARINKDFNVDHRLDRLFSNPTIEDIAAEIEKANWANTEALETQNSNDTENFYI